MCLHPQNSQKPLLFIYLLLERGDRREKGRETSMCKIHRSVASRMPPTHNPGMCPDWKSNQQTWGLQAGTQSTEPQQPGQKAMIFNVKNLIQSLITTTLHLLKSNQAQLFSKDEGTSSICFPLIISICQQVWISHLEKEEMSQEHVSKTSFHLSNSFYCYKYHLK